ncbi:hypothetical protein [Streptomyces sp. NPDC057428]|uniref:hypothetical protein n=1 Tax=Streptomyces sp. NPDC057428 TaxID=3346129 RepID=UPI0036B176A1
MRSGGPRPPGLGHQGRGLVLTVTTTRDEIDTDRIGALGICAPASSGWAPTARRTPPSSRACSTRPRRHAPQRPGARTSRACSPFPDAAEQDGALAGRHGFEYYRTDRARHRRSAQFLTWSSIDRMAFFDAFRFVQTARGPKELHWIDGASHVELYDKEQYLGPAVAELPDFFGERLARPRTSGRVVRESGV